MEEPLVFLSLPFFRILAGGCVEMDGLAVTEDEVVFGRGGLVGRLAIASPRVLVIYVSNV